MNWAKLSETIPLTDMILNPDFPWKWNHAIRIVRGAVFLEIDSDHQYVKLQLAADAGTLSEADICGDAGIAWNQYQITRLKYLDDATVIRIIQKYKFKFDCFSDCRNFNPQFVLQNPSVGWDVMTLINAHIHNYPEIFITGILKNTYMYA